MDINGKKVLVFGAGISGEAAAGLLVSQGADVVLYDGNTKLNASEISGRVPDGVKVILGEFQEELLDDIALTVMSPGVPTDLPVVDKAMCWRSRERMARQRPQRFSVRL